MITFLKNTLLTLTMLLFFGYISLGLGSNSATMSSSYVKSSSLIFAGPGW